VTLNPFLQLNLATILAVVLMTVGTLFALRRILLVPLIEVMERRRARIEAARAAKAAGEAALRAAEAEAEQVRAAATAEGARLTARLQEELAALRAERMAKASAEAEAILARGREELTALEQAEAARLETELHGAVKQTLTLMIGAVDDAAVAFMTKRVLASTQAG